MPGQTRSYESGVLPNIALHFAECMTRDAHTVDDELWVELRKYFDEGEIVELAAAVGLFNYFNRFNESLRMEPTK